MIRDVEALPSKASLLAALSLALDLVEGQPEGHALRTSRIACCLASEIGLVNQEDLFFAGMLKDSGCSNNSVRIHKIFGGDELLAKRAVKTIDWSSAIESVKFAFQHTERGKGLGAKLRRMSMNLGTPKQVMNQVTEARCTRAAEIATMLGFSKDVADGVRFLDEHWDGGGAPYGKRGDETPILARLLGIAQTFEVFLTAFGLEAAFDMVSHRSGRWFDPELAAALHCLRDRSDLWAGLEGTDTATFIESELPGLNQSAVDSDIDRICEAFAMIVDAKSSFTAEHSSRVTGYALSIADGFGLSKDQRQTLRRAGLLHDIGKLGVSSSILEKPGKLDDEEFERVKLHPQYSYQILSRAPTFSEIANLASAHHERLDGRGYWRGLGADELPLMVRILTVADVFDALTAERPYRGPMSAEDALDIMWRDAGSAFDSECLEALSGHSQKMAA